MDLAVSVHGLSKKYGDFLALDSIDLDVKKGELFALLGPNGAGKTTLMRVLTTQLSPNGGTASVLGHDVVKEDGDVRRLVSYVPQEMSVWTDITGYENLLIYAKIYGMPAQKREAKIKEVIQLMGLETFEHKLVSTFSGGMVRKLEIACALMVEPQILFLDEPTIGLDPAARKTVWEKLSQINTQTATTVFFTTHYMDEADNYASRIGMIVGGKIVKVDTPEGLKRSAGNERIEFEFGHPAGAALAKRIESLHNVEAVKLSGNTLTATSGPGPSPVNSIMETLLSGGAVVKRMSVLEPTIYDAFLKYAGNFEEHVGKGHLTELKRTRGRIIRG